MKLRYVQSGLSLHELLITVAIVAILAGVAAPSWQLWLQNGQIRATAESVSNGLQQARVEALKRNTHVRFQFASSLENNCALSANPGNWVVSLGDAMGKCAYPPTDPPLPPNAPDPANPYIIQMGSAAEGASSAVVVADQLAIAFNGLGRQVPVDGATPSPPVSVNINISNPSADTCVASGGKMKCLRVVVSPTGQIHLCDPALASGDSQACQ